MGPNSEALEGSTFKPLWLDQPARPARLPALTGSRSCELLIVGGGFTGNCDCPGSSSVIYDYLANSWHALPNMSQAGRGHNIVQRAMLGILSRLVHELLQSLKVGFGEFKGNNHQRSILLKFSAWPA